MTLTQVYGLAWFTLGGLAAFILLIGLLKGLDSLETRRDARFARIVGKK